METPVRARLKPPASSSPADLIHIDSRVERAAAASGRLLCAACGHPVTSSSQATERAGSHRHRFVNPHGRRFHIACFRRAPGCRETGSAHPEHSWFAGYAWRIALCERCGEQLGWGFEGPGREGPDHFFGLILARLSGRQ
jgi:hypothetical protein